MSEQPKTLGVYTVERELGRGGMGVVYLARDPRLDRPVAIKVLPDGFANDPERLVRFEREARLLASLNHPNIAGIHGVEEAEGHRLLVLEYVPGDSLAFRTERGPLPIDDALDICRQIAAAVEAAHEGGVVHRDLKPANVKITPDGTVKVLDFGLAKGGAGHSTGSEPDLTRSPTLALAATGQGAILGTAAYMSPEQARGKPVDRRTDIWSFGCVLYECLTGCQIFAGETASDMIARILERDPDWAALPAQTPTQVRDLLHRCLDKDPKKRLRDIGDARIELEEALEARSSSTRMAAAAAQARARAALSPRAMGLGALLILAGAIAGIGLWSALGPGAPGGRGAGRGPMRLSVGIPPTIHAFAFATLTPDDRSMVVYGQARRADGTDEPYGRLYTRRLDRYELEAIPGTERVQFFTFSPDGRWLAFVATISEESSERRLAKVPIDGSSPPVTLADWDEAWGPRYQWLEDGDILIPSDNSTRFFRVPSGGGPPKPATALDTGGVSAIFGLGNLLPGGGAVLLSAASWGARGYQNDQWLLDLKSGKARRLIENAGNARYVPPGYLVFTRGEALMAAPFDLGRLEIQGDMVALLSGVRTPNSWENGIFSVSDGGSLLYPPGGRVGTNRQLVIVDPAGSVAPFTSDRRSYENAPAASWDGRKVAVVVPNVKATYEVWVADQGRPVRRTLQLPTADCAAPVWSPDGQRLAFRRQARDQDDGIYVQQADGTGSPQPLLKLESQEVSLFPSSWAPDGSGLLVTKGVGGNNDILFLPIPASGGPARPVPLRATPYDEAAARFSPDGRLVAYLSDESGKYEVYVASYGAGGTLGPPLMVSSGGGYRPAWSGDRRLFYSTDADKLMSVAIETKPAISASAPAVIHDLKKLRVNSFEWDALSDGRILAIQKGEEEDDITQFHVILNWADELRARMGQGGAARR